MRIVGTLVWILLSMACLAQNDSLMLTNNTPFEEGIYLTREAFTNNRPDFQWEEVGGNIFINQKNHTARIEGLYSKLDSIRKPLPNIWGFCRFGVPFRQIDTIDNYQRFSTIKVRGRLCYYNYLQPVEETVEIIAYNPKTGIPFRRGQVNHEEEELVARFFEYETGQEYDFDLTVFMDYIRRRDEKLWNSLNKLAAEEANKKLYKCLLIYNDRHPLFIDK